MFLTQYDVFMGIYLLYVLMNHLVTLSLTRTTEQTHFADKDIRDPVLNPSMSDFISTHSR